MKHTLLVELFTEELPPKALPRLAASFAGAIVASLIEKKLVAADAQPTIFASPRRLGVSIPAVLAVAADEEAIEKIMPVAVALGADGQPSPALRKKLEARGIALDAVAQFERRLDGKSETFFYRYQAAGAKLADVLAGMVQDAAEKAADSQGDALGRFRRDLCSPGAQAGDAARCRRGGRRSAGPHRRPRNRRSSLFVCWRGDADRRRQLRQHAAQRGQGSSQL